MLYIVFQTMTFYNNNNNSEFKLSGGILCYMEQKF